MERIPILQMGGFLLVTIQVDMHDRLAMTLQDDLTTRIVEMNAKGVLIDISSLEIVDSFIGRILSNIASMSRLLDAETVVVESKLEVGSIFTVNLPCVYAEVEEKGSLPKPTKVLIIDDGEISRYLLKEQLGDRPYIVIEAINGSEGMLKAILEQPQVIFLDLVMPDLSGFEVLDQLKANPTTKHIPVIINTSKQLEPAERDRLINANAVAILSKDPTYPVASTTIREAL